MNNMMKTPLILVLSLFITLVSCKKDSQTNEPAPTPTPETGNLKIELEHLVDTVALVFGTKYANANNDTFTVSKFNYFISNIVITNNDNSTYAEPNSYHMVRHSVPGSNLLSITGVPLGSYKSIRFMLGVDSARNVSGAQTGDLDPAKVGDMFWGWNTGYIFLKLEGSSKNSGDASKAITFHIGGHAGINKTQRNFSFDFGTAMAEVKTNATPIVHLSVNVNELFKTPIKLSFASTYNQTAAGAAAKLIADNYADMIGFRYVHNF
jgi:hypothetical protein